MYQASMAARPPSVPSGHSEPITCPFCSFSVPSQEKLHTWQLMQHVELSHSETGHSPFRVCEDSPNGRSVSHSPSHSRPRPNSHPGSRSPAGSPYSNQSPQPAGATLAPSWQPRSRSRSNTPSGMDGSEDEEDYYVECPLEDCGEAVHVRELAHHMDLHDSESMDSIEIDDEREQVLPKSPHSPHSPHSPSFLGVPPPPQRQRSGSATSNGSSSHRPSGSQSRSASFDSRRGRSPSSQHLLAPPTTIQSYPRRPSPGYFAGTDPSRRCSAPPPLPPPTSSKYPVQGWKRLFLGPAPRRTRNSQKKVPAGTVRRLGKSELGPHAFEERMPDWLFRQLQRGPKMIPTTAMGPAGLPVRVDRAANESYGIIPVLAQLCQQDQALSKVFLCHPCVRHIYKQRLEGGFCGYRNIQMVASFIQETRFPGFEKLPTTRTPGIPWLQDHIEAAWDNGFNSQGRTETGGIRGTRKYIGTPEAQALFDYLDIGTETNAFNKPPPPQKKANGTLSTEKKYVHDHVFEAVFSYFSTGVTDPTDKVYQTGLAPIYFQHPGHSLTIVGLEVRKSGLMHLLVFDPMFKTSRPVAKLAGQTFRSKAPGRLLKAFRRGDSYLAEYNSFEILKLTAPRPAWNPMQMPNPGVLSPRELEALRL